MPSCELCGKDTLLFHADVEGTELKVCKACGSFGKIAVPMNRTVQHAQLPQELQLSEAVTPSVSKLVKNAREHKKLTQKEFAKMINEKESIIHKIETGAFEPSIALARKLEKALNIRLVETVEEEHLPKGKSSGPVTIGDIIKRK